MRKSFQDKFVEKEINMFQEKFNETFGDEIVFDVRARQTVFLAICFLGILGKKMNETDDKVKIQYLIQKYVRSRNVLVNFFINHERYSQGKEESCNARFLREKMSIGIVKPTRQNVKGAEIRSF